jgi:large subunit ribosomal protein L4
MPGGGRSFGPKPRDYRTDMPKAQRRQALVSALSLRAGENAVTVLDKLAFDAPKTRAMAETLARLGLTGKRTLLVLDQADVNVVKSCRNLKNLRTVLAHQVNAYELLQCDIVLLTSDSLNRMKEVFVR